jgi:hypothetical protein
MYDSPHITDGSDTTNISESAGGMADENTNFIMPNGAIKDTDSTLDPTAFATNEYLEAEFSIIQTEAAGYDVPYCFRLAAVEAPLNVYTQYAELTTAPERDFEIQRGVLTITGATTTLTAGVDYVAPASSSRAFIRITNTQHTGAGRDSLGNTQNADDVSAYIVNPANIMHSVTFARIGPPTNNTRVYWEIVEFIGEPGSDNEMIVRSQDAVTYGTTSTQVNGAAVSGVDDDSAVVVFITGQASPDASANNYAEVDCILA